jgi:hypothetical protein
VRPWVVVTVGNYGVGAAVLTFLASMIRWVVDGRGYHSPPSQLGWCFRIRTDSVRGRIQLDSMGFQLLISLLASHGDRAAVPHPHVERERRFRMF